MFMRITIVAIGVLMCTLATAQQLEDRVLELEHRVDQLEDKILQISSPSSTAKPPSSQSWRSLKREMTEKEVQSILGEPGRVQVTVSFTSWEYPDGGGVLFHPNGRLQAWSEPH